VRRGRWLTNPARPGLRTQVICVALVLIAMATLPAWAPFEDACILHLDPALPSPIRAPSREFFLGTDPLGRSEALRLAHALRTSVALAAPATLASCAFGIAIGALSGSAAARRGDRRPLRAIDGAIHFALDVLLAIPFVLVVACIAALVDAPTPATLVGAMTLASTPGVAKFARDRAIAAYAEPFVDAAQALGSTRAHVLLRHVLPQVAGFVVAFAPSLFGQLVLAESALGFLGLGLPAPAATLGGMIADGQDFVGEAPRLLALPSLTIAALVWLAGSLADALASKEPRDG